MKLKRLNKGNYLTNKKLSSFPISITNKQIYDINCILEGEKVDMDFDLFQLNEIPYYYRSIPLQKEHLVGFGFTHFIEDIGFDLIYEDYRLGNFVVIIAEYNDKTIVGIEYDLHDIEARTTILRSEDYQVHELQNLYYELTNKELTFKK